MDFPALPARLAHVREVIAKRQRVGGWSHEVRIVAVTKGHPAAAVRAAHAAGLAAGGENRMQEALAKQEAAVDVSVEWHLIGTLQRNKARNAAGRFALIHSVDREDLALELDRRAAAGTRQPVLVQVNCSAEPQKGGVDPQALPALLDTVAGCDRLELRGLMTLAPDTDREEEQRPPFELLRQLRDAGERAGHRLPELSM